MSLLRVLFATGLSLLYPGAGHALLRDWARALMFAGVFTFTTVVMLPVEEVTAARSVPDLFAVVTGEPWLVQFVLSFLFLFAAIDAGYRSLGLPPRSNGDAETLACPNCGRELDEELEFCHWCTIRLEWPEEVDESAAEDSPRPNANPNGDSESESRSQSDAASNSEDELEDESADDDRGREANSK